MQIKIICGKKKKKRNVDNETNQNHPAHKCVNAMKHRYRDKEHQLMKIREEEQELAEAVDRKITREELRIIETMKEK